MHLVAPCCTLYLASQPVLRGCTLHSRPADRPAGNSLLLPLLARAGSRLLDKVRGGARGESNPPIILTWLPTTPPYLPLSMLHLLHPCLISSTLPFLLKHLPFTPSPSPNFHSPAFQTLYSPCSPTPYNLTRPGKNLFLMYR